ncbi:MAG: DNA alkylation repair protein [Candidatus Aminicenantes bacterium]|nr:MAG: DNA alkylation repair protein [Candidatus Aminicenantes bacterium]
MKKIEEKFLEIKKFCEKNANPEIEKKYSRYFTEGYDSYGLDRKIFESQRDKWLKLWKGEFTINDYIALGDKLISTGKYEEASFAVSFIYSQLEDLTAETFERLGNWLEKGIVNWAHTDVLSGKALSYFITNKIVEIDAFKDWTESASKWKRRSVPVTLIDAIKTDTPLERLFKAIEPIMLDADEFVQKGLGWFLREAWKVYPQKTEDFLLKWKDTCGRIIIQYATEKMDKENKVRFRRAK